MADRNETPVQQWLDVWHELMWAEDEDLDEDRRLTHLTNTVEQLYLLLEPPSVREARLKDDAVLLFVEEDE